MAAELNLRPDRLRTHAATAAALADELLAAAARAGRGAEFRRATRELTELSEELAGAATAAERGERAAVDSFGRLRFR